MKRSILIIIFLGCIVSAHSQQLTSQPNGGVYSENRRMTPSEVRALLATKPELLDLYTTGRTKKTMGNGLIVAGILCMAGDLGRGLTADVHYPGALTFIGGGCLLTSVIVKTGFSRRIRNAINGYNALLSENDNKGLGSIAFVSNNNGLGLQVTLW